MKRIFQSIALLLLFTTTVEAQINQYGIPFITNYTIKDYKAGTQNWTITQDNRGVLYFGNKSGILEYDGLNWRLIEVGNKSTVRSLGVDKRGVVYVGALAEFGYLAPDSTGLLRYVSISQSLDSVSHKFSNVWEIGSIGSNVFFRTEEAMFRFNYEQGASSGKQIKIWKAGDDIFKKMVVVNDKLYIRQRNLGILELTGDSLRLIPGGQAVNDSIVANAIMPYSKSQLLVGTSEALYLYDTQKTSDVFSLFPLQSASLFESNRLYDGILIPGNSYALATKQGVVSIDQYGKLINWVNKQTFLQDEAVKFVYCNWTNNQLAPLWLALNDGIAKVEINSPIRLWNEATGLKGTVYDVIRYNSILYSATNMGAFYLNTPSNLLPSFAQVAKLPTSVWCFAIADVPTNPTKKNKPTNASILLAGADDGIYRITDIDAEIIFPTRAVFKILPSKLQPAIIFIGMADGLAILSYLNAKPELVKIPSINERIRSIAEDDHGCVWLSTDNNGVIKIDFKNYDLRNQDNYIIEHLDTLQGLPVISDIKISRFQDELLFFTEKGIYQFNEDTHKFTTFLTNIENFIPTSTSIFRFIEDHKGNCWIRANGEPDWTEVIYKQNDGSFRRDTIAFKRLPAMSVQTIYPETNGITWIGGSDGLYSYNTKVKPVIGTQYQTLIRKVTIGRDSIIFNGTFHSLDSIIGLIPTFEQDQNSLPVFDYKFNSVIFHFVAPFFEDEKVLQYSYFLEGFDENWSDWTNENKAGYTNLNAGDYIFRVKAKNIYGIESSEAKFSFTVQPPWYRTFFAYLLYVVAAIVLIWGLVKLNTQRLIHEKKNLERIVTERTAEIRRQAKELEKLSLVASETDNAIVIMQADGTFDWINAGFTRLFGFTLDDLVAQKRNSIMAFNNQVDANELNNCIQNKMSINYEAAIRTGNEDLVWVQVTLTPVLDKSGVLIRIIAINSDITVQKLYLAEILQQKEEIEAQRDEIEKQRDEIEKQRDEIAEHQKSIMDSILYASRIQTALLPPEQIMSTIIADHFILYKPRDVVSGDFYWMTQRDNRIIVAVADCTGHGVPGAFMSMLGIAFLNEIVVKTNPNEVLNAHDILNRLREHVISALRQTGGDGEAKDGMDISLCVINLDVNKLQFAGAYNPAYLVRATSNNQPELIQIDADKMPIGIHYRKDKLFSVKEVDISKGDALYMLSDGYVDQFGGPDGKKFMSKGFKNLLLSIQNETMREQKRHIEKALTDWMSYHDPDGKQYQQIDDILVMGLRF